MKTEDLKRKGQRVLTAIAGLGFGLATAASAQSLNDFRTVASGNWDSLTTWERYNGTTWVTGYYPTNAGANVVTIRNGHTVTVAAAVTSDQVTIEAGGQVTVNSGITWTIANGTGTDLTVAGTLDNSGTVTLNTGSTVAMQSGATYRHSQNGGTIPTATWNAGSTCEISGVTSTAPGGLGQTFSHFTWNCSGQTAAININALTGVNGDFTVTSTGSGSLSWISANVSKTIGGNLNIQDGTFTFCITATGTRSLTVSGNLNLSGGTFDFCTSGAGTPSLSLAGNYNQTGGTFQNSSGVLSVNFTGVNKTFSQSAGTLDTANMNFNVNSSAVLTLNNDLSVSTSRTLTVNSGGTLDCGTSLVTGAGAFTLSSGGTLSIGSPDGITSSGATGNIQVTGTRTFNTGAHYIYNGSAAQSTGSGLPATVASLTIANTAGTVTLGSSVTVTGTLTIQSGANLDAADKTITLSAGGTPLVVNGTFTPSTSTVAYTSTTGANVTGGINYYNLTVNSSGDTFTAAADFTVQSVLTVTSGTIFNGNGKTITLSGAGTPFAMSGSFNAAGSTIVYASASGANVSALVYSNLSIAGSGTFALAGSPTIAGTLTLSSGDLSIGANTLNLNGPVAIGSGTLTGGASANLNVGGSGAGITLPGIINGLNNLTLNRANGATLTGPVSVGGTLTLTAGQLAGASNLTLGSGASISRAAGSLDAAPTFAGTLNVTYTATGVTTGPELPASDSALNNLTINSGVAVTLGSSVTVNGTLTLAASSSSLNDGGNTLSVKGTISNAGTHSSTGSGKIRFNGAAAQSFAGTYGNVEIANAAGVSVGATTINGDLTVTTGQLTVGGITLTVNGTTSIASTLAITGTAGTKTFGSVIIQSGGVWTNGVNEAVSIKGNFQCDGSFTSGTAAYTFEGTGAQDIGGSASPTFASLTIGNTAQPVTASGNFNVSGTLSVSAGAVLEPAPAVVINSAAPAGTLSGSGTIKVTRTAATPSLTSQYRFSTYTLTSMTVDYAGNGDQTISNPGTHANLRTSGSGTKTLGGDLTVSGVVTVGSGTTLNGGSAVLTLSGSGTPFVVQGAFTPASGTVRYTSTAAANNVTGGISYNNLTIAAGAVGDIFTVTGGNLAINGDLTINAGTLDLGAFLADRTSPGGTLTLANSSAAKLKIGGTGTLPANYSTHVIGTSSTVEYGGSTQTIAALNSGQSYGNLTTSGSGTKSINGLVEVAGTFTVGTTAPVVVQSGGVLRNQTTAFTLNGTLSFASGATYRHERNGGTIPTATWNANSTCEIIITGNATSLSGVGQSFGHVVWNSPSQTAAVQLSGALTTVNGNLTIQSTGSGSIRLTTTTSPTLIIGGNLVLSGGTLDLSSTTGSASTTISVGGDLSISGTGVLTESGSGTTNTVAFPAGTHAFSNSGSIQNTVHFVVNSGATLNMGTSAVTGGGNFTLNAGATLGIGSPDGIAASGATGNVRNTGTRTFSTGANYTYNGSVAQVVGTGLPATVNNLTIANPAGVTLNSTHTVTGTCTVESGALLKGTGTINGVMVVNGTVAPGLSIGTFTLGASPTLNGTVLMEIDRDGSPNADKLVVSGNPLAFGGTLVVTNIGAALQGGEQFDLFDATGFSGAFSATNLPPLASGLNWWAGRLMTEGKLVVNRAPSVANTGFSRGAGTSLKIKVSDLLALCGDADTGDGDSIAFDSVNSGLQGATVTSDANYVFYLPGNNNNDTLVYKVRDQRGGTNAANIAITVVNSGGLVQSIDTSGGGVTVHFSGIPGYPYAVERAEDVNFTVNVTVVLTTNAPANGQFSYTDPDPPQPMAYYRLKYNP